MAFIVKRKWVLLTITIILFLFMFYEAFRLLYLKAYIPADDVTPSWLTTILRQIGLISEQAAFMANPEMVNHILILLVSIFLSYAVFTLFLDAWFSIEEKEKHNEPFLFSGKLYKKDNAILAKELEQAENLVIAIDDVTLFLNTELLQLCSKRHFILLCDDVVERYQQAIELVKSNIMRQRYEDLLFQLTENTDIRAKILFYRGSNAVIRDYYLDQSYTADKFLASCITAAEEENFKIKVVSRNEAIINKSKQLGFLTYQLTSLIDEEAKEVNVWETEENRGIVH